MVTIPAAAWRGEFAVRALTIGPVVGLCLGALAWLDSGFWLSGVVVFVVVGTLYGVLMARRMARYWPGARDLNGEQRVAVARAVRRGEAVGAAPAGTSDADDARLSQPVIDYRDGLRAAAETGWWLRWLLIFILVVAVGTAVWDWQYGSWGNAIASAIYLVALLAEVFWMPKYQTRLLANADQAAALARKAL
ncbi:hypothetical protein MycrhN_5296 [Mycolicibacterium rhodesiae NBB3]|uniref:Transmembrane protein n=1 Tax=Mycolicibacterium rhodesiae (strain NBB3) TaxID=710685 RepID=G8RYY0_MYCRN|nr:hypothetical protein [Mycolicibacterium rhodesiae]AEV75771.1 hypothetical protein MycrhN_5296 [Mycolicibacterium rhodesiae NBB3]